MSKVEELQSLAEKVQNLRVKHTEINDQINTRADRVAYLEPEMKNWGYFTPQRKEMNQEVTTLKAEIATLTKEEAQIKKELSKLPSIDELKKKLADFGVELVEPQREETAEEEEVSEEFKPQTTIITTKNSPDFIIKAAETEAKSISDAKTKYKPLKSIKVDDKITFGVWYQSSKDNKEDIEWQVLAKKGKKILVLTTSAIDCKPFNKIEKPTTWADCSLRKWLNDEFFKEAFTIGERSLISMATVNADKNSNYATSPGFKTKDKIYLLSIVDTKKHIGKKGLDCKPTEYAKYLGAYVDEDNGNCWWWLRTPGEKPTEAAYVGVDGMVRHAGDSAYIGCGSVRPAMWIDLSLLN